MFVSIDKLTKIYGAQRAIDSISFGVEKGEILGFLGPNGAGKSTTMKIITCYLPPTEGDVQIGGVSIHDASLEIRRQVGYLPEHNPLYLDMYVHEFLRFAGKIQRMGQGEIEKRISEVIEMTGLGREQHKKIGMLSKGYRQRVGISQALIHNPPVLILDEPTTGLDPNQIIDIRNMIRTIGKDKTIIFSSHILSEVEAIADRVVIINKGKIVADAPTSDLAKMGEDNVQISIGLDKKGFDVAALEKMKGVLEVQSLTETEWRIRTDMQTEIRPAIFKECVRQNFTLMSLSKEEFTLEDTFRKLTQ